MDRLSVQDVSADVRQSAFALVGDLARVATSHFAPSIGDLLALGIANLQPAMLRQESMSACNNACWSLGELPEDLREPLCICCPSIVPAENVGVSRSLMGPWIATSTHKTDHENPL